tara:strand:+ start:83 stop:694 length:612 start_codon:yes stop_codon:yes gene_type:complete
MKCQGKLTSWNDEKGFGFVEQNATQKRAFVHISSFLRRSRRPVKGDLIIYEQVSDGSGKFKAKNVSLVADKALNVRKPAGPAKLGYWVVASFSVMLALLYLRGAIPSVFFFYYLAASCIAYIMYAFDKSAAKRDSRRTPESYLHVCSLLGGWPGAFVAQQTLRHKTQKAAFKTVYRVTVIVNLVVFVWFLNEDWNTLMNIAGS